MSPSELAELFEQNPDRAFRITLSSGDVVDVKNPRRTLIDNIMLYVSQSDDPRARVGQSTRIISIPNIAIIEPADPRKPEGRRRR
jgi:hypothetical protein